MKISWKKNFANSIEIISFANQFQTKVTCPGGGIGRRAGFKIQFWQQSAGSIPAPGTKKQLNLLIVKLFLFFKEQIKDKNQFLTHQLLSQQLRLFQHRFGGQFFHVGWVAIFSEGSFYNHF